MDAVYSHLLTQPQIRFLIADDPGAGKTIMGGLMLKELKFWRLVERTLIVTPANRTDQWRRELQDKFGETFAVNNWGTVGAAFGRNVWDDNVQCITSIDFVARQDDILNLLRDVRWDLVVVDEAHKMAAYRYGQKVNTTQRHEFGEFLRDRTDHFLFLTAMPHKATRTTSLYCSDCSTKISMSLATSWPRPADESFKLAQALGMDTEIMWHRTGVLDKSGENVQAVPVAKRTKIKDLGEPNADNSPASLIDVLHCMCICRNKGDTTGMAEFFASSGQGKNPTLWLVAQAVSEFLPDGDKVIQLMQGLLNRREKLDQEPSLF